MKVYHGGEYPMTVYDVVYKDDLIYFLMYLGEKWTLVDARECTVKPIWMPSYEEEMGFDESDKTLSNRDFIEITEQLEESDW